MAEGGFLRQFDALCQSLPGLLGLHGRFGGFGGESTYLLPNLNRCCRLQVQVQAVLLRRYSSRTSLRCTVSKGEKIANWDVFGRFFIIYVPDFFFK